MSVPQERAQRLYRTFSPTDLIEEHDRLHDIVAGQPNTNHPDVIAWKALAAELAERGMTRDKAGSWSTKTDRGSEKLLYMSVTEIAKRLHKWNTIKPQFYDLSQKPELTQRHVTELENTLEALWEVIDSLRDVADTVENDIDRFQELLDVALDELPILDDD